MGASVVVAIDNGIISIQGRFSGIGDPAFLKHRAAVIEGVIDIKIHAMSFASVNRHRVMGQE